MFNFIKIHSSIQNNGYFVNKKYENLLFISFYTPSYKNKAMELIASLENHHLFYVVYEVPTVHNSISPKGSNDLNYTKSNLISNCLKLFNKNLVYLDCDCILIHEPVLFLDICQNNDFSIFNWLSHYDNNCYKLLENSKIDYGLDLYLFSHSIDTICEEQLLCSGAVQFWANNQKSIDLLNYWQYIIAENPFSPDDYCLDFAFNNFNTKFNYSLNFQWLPTNYVRYAWWLFDEPIIDHPDFPNNFPNWKEVDSFFPLLRVYSDKFNTSCKSKNSAKLSGFIDIKNKLHITFDSSNNLKFNNLNSNIWHNGKKL